MLSSWARCPSPSGFFWQSVKEYPISPISLDDMNIPYQFWIVLPFLYWLHTVCAFSLVSDIYFLFQPLGI
ncbi:hypothetical protein GJAV_G00267940 [Gymnothorax javanicus]|nr:hypothetical protein GJAV_G00267940 [Gymnothorax javanicus]